ncbi:lipopolysaccharide biosynthesis protein [Blastopirellula marina]|uniref:Lipopolysaccharide biosynthesis protein n=1 Tax=Blastopirellula marina TaxID=124 RepID=A0A2S8GHF9_9BACT|nr:lipopolysaccharide biosynthesis protein [Blastopirellula marina]PQO43896.1 hypothetical protein C5Y93_22180 [Blastopirellula marina]
MATAQTKSLKRDSMIGGVAALLGQVCKFILRLATVVVLARFLSPEDYGLIAIVTAITSILVVFRDAGLSMATIQKPEVNQVELSSMHWLNVSFGFLTFVGVSLFSPLLAWMYERPEVFWLFPCYGFLGFVGSFATQRSAIMQRELRFPALAKCDVLSQFAGVVTGIISAAYGLGFWSLVIMEGVSTVARNLLLLSMDPWRPSFLYSHKEAKPLLRFGFSVMCSNALLAFSRGIDALTIGQFYGLATVGLFNRAQSLMNTPMNQMIAPVMSVARSAIFRVSDDRSAFESAVIKISRHLFFLTSIIAISAIGLAPIIVVCLLGPEWNDCTPMFRVLAMFAVVEPVSGLMLNVLISKGDSGALLRWRIFSITIIILGLIIGIQWGALGMVTTYATSGILIRAPLLLIYSCKKSGISLATYWKRVAPTLLSATVALVVSYGLAFATDNQNYLQLVFNWAISLSIFILAHVLLPDGIAVLAEVRNLAGDVIQTVSPKVREKLLGQRAVLEVADANTRIDAMIKTPDMPSIEAPSPMTPSQKTP